MPICCTPSIIIHTLFRLQGLSTSYGSHLPNDVRTTTYYYRSLRQLLQCSLAIYLSESSVDFMFPYELLRLLVFSLSGFALPHP